MVVIVLTIRTAKTLGKSCPLAIHFFVSFDLQHFTDKLKR